MLPTSIAYVLDEGDVTAELIRSAVTDPGLRTYDRVIARLAVGQDRGTMGQADDQQRCRDHADHERPGVVSGDDPW